MALDDRTWGFYGRAAEQAEIERILASRRWFFCAVSGRRRIGKTTLIRQAMQGRSGVRAFYFQVPDSDERGVVQAFQDAMEDSGTASEITQRAYRTFGDMASVIGTLCRLGFIVLIDEFQYFHRNALAPFTSFLQAEVDKLRDSPKGGLFVLGSIHTEMMAILEDHGSPLFNRVTHRITVGHWDFATLFEMFDAHDIIDPAQRLFFWSLFEGVPKFYRDCFEQEVLEPSEDYRTRALRRLFFEGASPLREEATTWFLRELRGRYDSVLKLLAYKGPCSYRDLVTAHAGRKPSYDEVMEAKISDLLPVERELTAYLHTLIDRFQMVEKLHPIFAGDNSRKARYVITDNFLAAWLKALSRAVQMARIQPMNKAIERADTGLRDHEGYTFEKMIRLLTEECSREGKGDFALTDVLRGYWNKANGSDIEIDLVAYNSNDKRVRFGSCKRAAEAHDNNAMASFETHLARFLMTKEGRQFSSWTIEKVLYSPNFSARQRQELERRGYLCRDLCDFARYLGRPILAPSDAH